MALDLRFPLGLMFAILGVILTAVGILRRRRRLGLISISGGDWFCWRLGW